MATRMQPAKPIIPFARLPNAKIKQAGADEIVGGAKKATSFWRAASTCALAGVLCGCVAISTVAPSPAQPGQPLTLRLKNIIGPTFLEPGAQVRFDGQAMLLNPNTSSQVGFPIPLNAMAGSHLVEVNDPPGLIEILTVVLLLRNRTDSRIVEIDAPVRVINLVPAALNAETNQDSEPFLTVHSRNPALMVASAFTPNPAGAAATTAPIYVTQDGGSTWALVNSVPAQQITGDITMAFDRDGPARGRLYTGILRPGNLINDKFFTDDAAAVAAMTLQNTNQNTDQPFVVVTSVGGRDRVYVGNNDFDAAPNTATVDVSLDSGTTWNSVRLEGRNSFNQNGPSVRPSVARNGVAYAAYFHRTNSIGQNRISDVVVVRDDAGATGANPFRNLVDSGDNLVGQRVVQGVTIPFLTGQALGQERIGSTLSLAVDPNNSATVYVAWADRVGNGDVYTVHVRRSIDSGQTWSADLRTLTNATNSALAIADNGTVGLLYQQLDNIGTANARWVTHLEQTRNAFANIQDTILATTPANAPARVFGPYLGDYTHLVAVGSSFRGVFSANNTPNLANFPQGVTYQRAANFTMQTLHDGAGAPVAISIDPFFFSAQVLR
jgi:hypothetical protein